MSAAGDTVQLVVFGVGGQQFACDIFQVERILRWEPPTPLPRAPAFLEGVMAYQDGSIPLMDLRKRLGVPAEVREETRVMVFDTEQGRIGAVVDAVLEVRKVDAATITRPSAIVRDLAASYISGLVRSGEGTIIVLAVGRLLTSAEQVALAELLAAVAG
jgi:purine-binding chemotaxis protein CheW